MSHDPVNQRSRALTGLDPSALVRLGMKGKAADGVLPEVPGYEMLESLGMGGMGEVFRARQESLGRAVAVKILRADLPAAGWMPERFEQEARTMAALQHPNVVTVHDCVRLEDGRVAIVMELVGGGTLRQKLAEAPKGLPLEQALRWAREIAEGLRAAHGAGLVHRDVKPDNVLIDDAGTARVSDFGLSFSGDMTRTRYTQTGAAAGTPGYMPPEIWRGETVDGRSDVFSYGAMLYEMLTGRLPQGSFPAPGVLRPDISPALSAAVMAALHPDPGRRPADMTAMLEAVTAKRGWSTRRKLLVMAPVVSGAFVMAGRAAWQSFFRDEDDRGRKKSPEELMAESEAFFAAEEARAKAGWTLIPWPKEPEKSAVSGGWRLEKGVLISDDRICILPVPGIPAEPCRLRLRFKRLSGQLSIGIFVRMARGTTVCTLDGRGRHLGGVQMVDGQALEESGGFFLPLENGRKYDWEVEVRRERIRMWVDGALREERDIAGKSLGVPGTWEWVPGTEAAAVHVGSWESATEFYSLEWQRVES